MDKQQIIAELSYKAVRSSGAGGQNVNKVSSKVVLSFNMMQSTALTAEEKLLVAENLKSRLTVDGILILNCDEDRSQIRNKDIVTKRFLNLIADALFVPKERKATRVPKSVIRKRIKDKKSTSEIKKNRKKPEL
ncbi:ribosome-associated protein [Flavobacterium tiangeerense]|uniref:Ribosome-associated protein n=1 Tax=Flavobacterium tiangeerense TaxID=459471 RepID=A0ABY3FMT6_9FLAO|nr:alternative ribosome rescue aminoacyl-tRNA hydrolase ArfB [Flavobacterium tiangeerense]TWI02370.1 ribosome-associated protein [Flavobacterium tiangeerense]